jgi:hypothetical protein
MMIARKLSRQQIEQIVAEYFGVHPKYFVYGGITIQVDITQFELDQEKRFIGWQKGEGPRAKVLDDQNVEESMI